jgi:hypothetical protein
MPCSVSAGCTVFRQVSACRSISSRLRVRLRSSTSRGISPLAALTATPAAIRRFSPAIRTM